MAIEIGEPTHCCYQYVRPKEGCGMFCEVHSYFLMDGIGCCIRFSDFASIWFYGHSFVHRTSFPLVVSKGKVFTASNLLGELEGTPRLEIFAWGSGGPKKNTTIASRTRAQGSGRKRKRETR